MRELAARVVVVADGLPKPPGYEEPDKEGNTLLILAVVVGILGVVVLVAWLLKPLVARRLAVATGEEHEETASTVAWDDAWSAPDRDDLSEHLMTEVAESAPPAHESIPEEPVESEPEPVEAPAEVTVALAATEHDTDAEAIVGITLTVRELLEAANAGQLLRGLSLYSEGYHRRFREDLGLSDEEFADRFADVPPPPPETHAALAAVTEVELHPDGRIRATITYADGTAAPPPERFIFVRAKTGDRWLIDDISAAE